MSRHALAAVEVLIDGARITEMNTAVWIDVSDVERAMSIIRSKCDRNYPDVKLLTSPDTKRGRVGLQMY